MVVYCALWYLESSVLTMVDTYLHVLTMVSGSLVANLETE